MPQTLAFLNGQFIAAAEFSISPADAGFVYGATATDLVRTFGGRLFRLADHFARFRESCRLCRIPLTVADADLHAAAEKLVTANRRGDEDLALVMVATPGPLGRYLGHADDGPSTVAMHTMPAPIERYRRLFTEGGRLLTVRAGTSPVDPHAKMRSRMHWWIAEQEAKAIDPHAWALFVDAGGFVAETAAANFLAVINGAVTSPPRTGILNGITLKIIENLSNQLGIPFVEKPLTVAECAVASELILCGTMFGVAGVRSFNAAELPWPGRITMQLTASWAELTAAR